MSGTAAISDPRSVDGARPAWLTAFLLCPEAPTLVAYFLRDLLGGAARYYLAMLRLEPLWFIPDLLAAICLAAFVHRTILRGNNAVALLVMGYLLLALAIGTVVLGTGAAAASSFKMILPLCAGFGFTGRPIGSYRRLLGWIHGMYYVAVLAVLVSSVQTMPWVGFKVETLGGVREAGRLWWAGDGDERLSGFAADSTMAAYFIMMTFVLTAPRRSLAWVLTFGSVGLYAAYISTSKTGFGVMALYMLAWAWVRLFPIERRFAVIRRLGLGSFAAMAVPIVLIVALAGIDLESINPILYSIQDRINNSWQLPFVYMQRFSLTGYLIGCGLGCFNYPHELFAPTIVQYWVPIDNFYVGTYLMLGVPFLIFMIFAIRSLARSRDVYRYTLAFTMNLYTITVLAYGPAAALLIFGIVLSDVFSPADDREPPAGAGSPTPA